MAASVPVCAVVVSACAATIVRRDPSGTLTVMGRCSRQGCGQGSSRCCSGGAGSGSLRCCDGTGGGVHVRAETAGSKKTSGKDKYQSDDDCFLHSCSSCFADAKLVFPIALQIDR